MGRPRRGDWLVYDTACFSPVPWQYPGVILILATSSRLVEPDRVVAHRVVNAEAVLRIAALYVSIPKFMDPLPGDRQQRRVLFHDRFGPADQVLALLCVDFPVDLGR